MRLSQTSAWALAIFLSIGIFASLYGISSYVAKKTKKEFEQTLKQFSDSSSVNEVSDEPESSETEVSTPENEEAQDSTLPKLTKSMLDKKWTYTGETGPQNWGRLSEDYYLCQEGKKQSPIDLLGAKAKAMPNLVFDYQKSEIELFNDGNTVRVNYAPGSYLHIGESLYELKYFDFHLPSEHKEDSIPYPMEMQIYHKDEVGQTVVVSVFFEEGRNNRVLQTIWQYLPRDETFPKRKLVFDLKNLLPETSAFYHYEGSMSTPPCNEGVLWYVMAKPTFVSSRQIEKFEQVFINNSRPIQARKDQLLYIRKN